MSKLKRVLAAARKSRNALTVPAMIAKAGLVETPALRREVLDWVVFDRRWRNAGNCPETRRTAWKWGSAP